ncbi:MAG TPA: hypothetical protein EYO59_13010, partial [Chromatiaceae bacterium]|nr:hypothetical protein [Chromatiaceae bacterium]
MADGAHNIEIEFIDGGSVSRGLTPALSIIVSTASVDCAASTATGIPVSECNALLALYTATSGANWTINSNWTAALPVSSWYGVTVANGNVTRLDLGLNDLNGSLPIDLGDLSELTHLFLQDNQLTGGIPAELNSTNLAYLYFSGNQLSGVVDLNFPALDTLYLADNQLTFTDLEIQVPASAGIANFNYAPQDVVHGFSCSPCIDGDNKITITPSLAVNANDNYQWYFNGQAIPGATARIHQKSSANLTDAGDYHYVVTNTLVPGLTLTSSVLTIGVDDVDSDAINHFVTRWKTDYTGTGSSDDTSIIIPLFPGETYDFSIDWDNDGVFDNDYSTDVDVTHTFSAIGEYTIRIKGTFPRIYFNNGGDRLKLIAV